MKFKVILKLKNYNWMSELCKYSYTNKILCYTMTSMLLIPDKYKYLIHVSIFRYKSIIH